MAYPRTINNIGKSTNNNHKEMHQGYRPHSFFVGDGRDKRSRINRVVRGGRRILKPQSQALQGLIDQCNQVNALRRTFKPFVAASRKEIHQRHVPESKIAGFNIRRQNWMAEATLKPRERQLPQLQQGRPPLYGYRNRLASNPNKHLHFG